MEEEKQTTKCPRCEGGIHLYTDENNGAVCGCCDFCGVTYSPSEIINSLLDQLVQAVVDSREQY